MRQILGLDLGTNSIGWAVIEKEKNEKVQLVDKGVVIFSEGVNIDKGIESSKATERTEKRSSRRNKFRRKLRKFETLKVLIELEMCPLHMRELLDYRESGFKIYPDNIHFLEWLQTRDELNKNPYYFRDKASREKIEKIKLGRALYHIAQRRGFLSNRLDKSDDGILEFHKPELLNIIDASENKVELFSLMEEYFIGLDILDKKAKDLDAGEAVLKRFYNAVVKIIKETQDFESITSKVVAKINDKRNLGKVKQEIDSLSDRILNEQCDTLGQFFYKLYNDNRHLEANKIRSNYTSREQHYLHEFNVICKKQDIDKESRVKLEKAIFYQRELKSQKGTVGKCVFEKDKSRCPASHPDFEEFRMLQFINSIKYKNTENKLIPLSGEQRTDIEDLFYRRSKPHFNFSEITKRLNIQPERFNYKLNTTVSACPTIALLKNALGQNWKQEIIVSKLDNNITYNYHDIWHVLFHFTSEKKLGEFAIEKIGLDEKKAKAFSNYRINKDYAALSLKAIKKIVPYLRRGLIYSHAVFMANMYEVVKKGIWDLHENQLLISKEIERILIDHGRENKINSIINGFLKSAQEYRYSYSQEAKQLYEKEIEELILKEFGNAKWKQFEDHQELMQKSIEKCLKAFKSEKFLKIKRIDERIIDFLDDNDLLGNKELLYHPSDLKKFKTKIVNGTKLLGSPINDSVKNPMAIKSLHILQKLINHLILADKIDSNTRVNIELARELNDANKRKAIKIWQNNNKSKKEDIIEAIKELYRESCNEEIEPSDTDILKYQLWKEQKRVCLYTEGENNNINICEVVGENTNTEIEHTIPRSLSYDNTRVNLTLAKKRANKLKDNKTPFEIGGGGNGLASHDEILNRIAHWKEEYEKLDHLISVNIRATKSAVTKEQKDKRIQQRHLLKMEYDYWKNKYDRFLMQEIPGGFARRQLNETGVITSLAREFLSSYFDKVYVVKGVMVDEFRKLWGLHEIEEKNDQLQYKSKDRSMHSHHCKDAITIACMDKNKYDLMAHAWRLEEKNKRTEAKKIITESLPWKSFAQDVKNVDDELIVVHLTKDKAPIQSRKKLRKRGKVQKNSKGEPIYQRGDTIRGSLHRDTFYGAIANKDDDGKIIVDQNNEVVPIYVERIGLDKLKKEQIKRIVDPIVRDRVQEACDKKILKFGKSNNSIAEEGIWMNKTKGIPIKKVRIKAVAVKWPLHIKKHRDLSTKKYKQSYHVMNDENYCMAIYENRENGKVIRESALVNMFDAAEYFKLSNKTRELKTLVPEHLDKGIKLKYILTKGLMVLLLEKPGEEIKSLNQKELQKRLHEITQLDVENGGSIKLLYHQEAREKNEITKFMGLKRGMKGGKNIGNVDKYPWIKLSVNSFDVLVERYDFEISIDGRIKIF